MNNSLISGNIPEKIKASHAIAAFDLPIDALGLYRRGAV